MSSSTRSCVRGPSGRPSRSRGRVAESHCCLDPFPARALSHFTRIWAGYGEPFCALPPQAVGSMLIADLLAAANTPYSERVLKLSKKIAVCVPIRCIDLRLDCGNPKSKPSRHCCSVFGLHANIYPACCCTARLTIADALLGIGSFGDSLPLPA